MRALILVLVGYAACQPIITNVTGCTANGCPTNGTTLTISGAFNNPSSVAVNVLHSGACIPVSTNSANNTIVCKIGPGSCYQTLTACLCDKFQVVVYDGNSSSAAYDAGFGYRQPRIKALQVWNDKTSQVDMTYCASSPSSPFLRDCTRNPGGKSQDKRLLRVIGEGLHNALILVGDLSCSMTGENADSVVDCIFPNLTSNLKQYENVTVRTPGLCISSDAAGIVYKTCDDDGSGVPDLLFPSICHECEGGEVPTNGKCLRCPDGTIQKDGKCTPCLQGERSLDGQCVVCQQGTYNPDLGSVACPSCPPGTYQAETGKTLCEDCPPGRFAEGRSIKNQRIYTECDPCPPGKISRVKQAACDLCDSGTYNPGLGRARCDDCAPGNFSERGASTCEKCPAGTFSSLTRSTECQPCPEGKYSEAGFSACKNCPVGTYSNREQSTSCEPCWAGSFQEKEGQQSCDTCKPEAAKYYIGGPDGKLVLNAIEITDFSVLCKPCPSGALCVCSNVSRTDSRVCNEWTVYAKSGFYLAVESDGNAIALPCLPKFCLSGDQCDKDVSASRRSKNTLDDRSTSFPGFNQLRFVSCCGESRDHASVNPLCGSCMEGFTQWGSSCLECTEVNTAIVVFAFCLMWLLVLALHQTAQKAGAADIKILLYFIQTSLLFFPPSTEWLSWLELLNFNFVAAGEASASQGECIAAVSPMTQLLAGVFSPCVAAGQLAMTMFISWCINRILVKYAGKEGKFNSAPYWRSMVGLFLFSYNSIANTTLNFFQCTTVLGTSVIAKYPAIRCDSEEYKAYKPLFSMLLAVVVIGFPLIIGSVLVIKKRELRKKEWQARIGTLYEVYTHRRFYWEVVILFRRIVVNGVVVGLSDNDKRNQMLQVASFVNVVLMVLHMLASPFGTMRENQLETFSLTMLALLTLALYGVQAPFTLAESIFFSVGMVALPAAIIGFSIFLRNLETVRGATGKKLALLIGSKKPKGPQKRKVEAVHRRCFVVFMTRCPLLILLPCLLLSLGSAAVMYFAKMMPVINMSPSQFRVEGNPATVNFDIAESLTEVSYGKKQSSVKAKLMEFKGVHNEWDEELMSEESAQSEMQDLDNFLRGIPLSEMVPFKESLRYWGLLAPSTLLARQAHKDEQRLAESLRQGRRRALAMDAAVGEEGDGQRRSMTQVSNAGWYPYHSLQFFFFDVASFEAGNVLRMEVIQVASDFNFDFPKYSAKADSKWQSYCFRGSPASDVRERFENKCLPPNSATKFFMPSWSEEGKTWLFDAKNNTKPNARSSNVEVGLKVVDKNQAGNYFDNGYKVKSKYPGDPGYDETSVDGRHISSAFYSVFLTGLPPPGKQLDQKNANKLFDEAKTHINQYYKQGYFDDVQAKLEVHKVQLVYNGEDILSKQLLEELGQDMILASLSFGVVFVYMWYHTSSLFLALMGMFGVICAVPMGLLMTAAIYGTNLSFMNGIAFWIIAGVGADDVFVFVDHWRGAPKWDRQGRALPLSMRLTYTYKKATAAMLATSVTSAVAFLTQATSKIGPIAQFGFFTGILVMINYLYVITWLPAVVIVQFRFCQCKRLTALLNRLRKSSSSDDATILARQTSEATSEMQSRQHRKRVADNVEPGEDDDFVLDRKDHDYQVLEPLPEAATACIQLYFRILFKLRYLVLLGCIILFVVLLLKLPPESPAETQAILPKTHNFELAQRVLKIINPKTEVTSFQALTQIVEQEAEQDQLLKGAVPSDYAPVANKFLVATKFPAPLDVKKFNGINETTKQELPQAPPLKVGFRWTQPPYTVGAPSAFHVLYVSKQAACAAGQVLVAGWADQTCVQTDSVTAAFNWTYAFDKTFEELYTVDDNGALVDKPPNVIWTGSLGMLIDFEQTGEFAFLIIPSYPDPFAESASSWGVGSAAVGATVNGIAPSAVRNLVLPKITLGQDKKWNGDLEWLAPNYIPLGKKTIYYVDRGSTNESVFEHVCNTTELRCSVSDPEESCGGQVFILRVVATVPVDGEEASGRSPSTSVTVETEVSTPFAPTLKLGLQGHKTCTFCITPDTCTGGQPLNNLYWTMKPSEICPNPGPCREFKADISKWKFDESFNSSFQEHCFTFPSGFKSADNPSIDAYTQLRSDTKYLFTALFESSKGTGKKAEITCQTVQAIPNAPKYCTATNVSSKELKVTFNNTEYAGVSNVTFFRINIRAVGSSENCTVRVPRPAQAPPYEFIVGNKSGCVNAQGSVTRQFTMIAYTNYTFNITAENDEGDSSEGGLFSSNCTARTNAVQPQAPDQVCIVGCTSRRRRVAQTVAQDTRRSLQSHNPLGEGTYKDKWATSDGLLLEYGSSIKFCSSQFPCDHPKANNTHSFYPLPTTLISWERPSVISTGGEIKVYYVQRRLQTNNQTGNWSEWVPEDGWRVDMPPTAKPSIRLTYLYDVMFQIRLRSWNDFEYSDWSDPFPAGSPTPNDLPLPSAFVTTSTDTNILHYIPEPPPKPTVTKQASLFISVKFNAKQTRDNGRQVQSSELRATVKKLDSKDPTHPNMGCEVVSGDTVTSVVATKGNGTCTITNCPNPSTVVCRFDGTDVEAKITGLKVDTKVAVEVAATNFLGRSSYSKAIEVDTQNTPRLDFFQALTFPGLDAAEQPNYNSIWASLIGPDDITDYGNQRSSLQANLSKPLICNTQIIFDLEDEIVLVYLVNPGRSDLNVFNISFQPVDSNKWVTTNLRVGTDHPKAAKLLSSCSLASCVVQAEGVLPIMLRGNATVLEPLTGTLSLASNGINTFINGQEINVIECEIQANVMRPNVSVSSNINVSLLYGAVSSAKAITINATGAKLVINFDYPTVSWLAAILDPGPWKTRTFDSRRYLPVNQAGNLSLSLTPNPTGRGTDSPYSYTLLVAHNQDVDNSREIRLQITMNILDSQLLTTLVSFDGVASPPLFTGRQVLYTTSKSVSVVMSFTVENDKSVATVPLNVTQLSCVSTSLNCAFSPTSVPNLSTNGQKTTISLTVSGTVDRSQSYSGTINIAHTGRYASGAKVSNSINWGFSFLYAKLEPVALLISSFADVDYDPSGPNGIKSTTFQLSGGTTGRTLNYNVTTDTIGAPWLSVDCTTGTLNSTSSQATCQVTVTNPHKLSPKRYSTNITIRSDDLDLPVQKVAVTFTVKAGNFAITPQSSLSLSHWVGVGNPESTSTTRNLVMTNSGLQSRTVKVSSVSLLSTEYAPWVTIDGVTGSSQDLLGGGQGTLSKAIAVRHGGWDVGTYTVVFQVQHDSPDKITNTTNCTLTVTIQPRAMLDLSLFKKFQPTIQKDVGISLPIGPVRNNGTANLTITGVNFKTTSITPNAISIRDPAKTKLTLPQVVIPPKNSTSLTVTLPSLDITNRDLNGSITFTGCVSPCFNYTFGGDVTFDITVAKDLIINPIQFLQSSVQWWGVPITQAFTLRSLRVNETLYLNKTKPWVSLSFASWTAASTEEVKQLNVTIIPQNLPRNAIKSKLQNDTVTFSGVAEKIEVSISRFEPFLQALTSQWSADLNDRFAFPKVALYGPVTNVASVTCSRSNSPLVVSVVRSLTLSLAQAGNLELNISMANLIPGNNTVNCTIVINDAGVSVTDNHTIFLTGNAATLTFSPPTQLTVTVDYATSYTTREIFLNISNTGTANATVTLQVSPKNNFTTADVTSGTVGKGLIRSFRFFVQPGTLVPGNYTDNITVFHDAPRSGQSYNVTVLLVIQRPSFDSAQLVTPSPINVYVTPAGNLPTNIPDLADRTLLLVNSGQSSLKNVRVSVTGDFLLSASGQGPASNLTFPTISTSVTFSLIYDSLCGGVSCELGHYAQKLTVTYDNTQQGAGTMSEVRDLNVTFKDNPTFELRLATGCPTVPGEASDLGPLTNFNDSNAIRRIAPFQYYLILWNTGLERSELQNFSSISSVKVGGDATNLKLANVATLTQTIMNANQSFCTIVTLTPDEFAKNEQTGTVTFVVCPESAPAAFKAKHCRNKTVAYHLDMGTPIFTQLSSDILKDRLILLRKGQYDPHLVVDVPIDNVGTGSLTITAKVAQVALPAAKKAPISFPPSFEVAGKSRGVFRIVLTGNGSLVAVDAAATCELCKDTPNPQLRRTSNCAVQTWKSCWLITVTLDSDDSNNYKPSLNFTVVVQEPPVAVLRLSNPLVMVDGADWDEIRVQTTPLPVVARTVYRNKLSGNRLVSEKLNVSNTGDYPLLVSNFSSNVSWVKATSQVSLPVYVNGSGVASQTAGGSIMSIKLEYDFVAMSKVLGDYDVGQHIIRVTVATRIEDPNAVNATVKPAGPFLTVDIALVVQHPMTVTVVAGNPTDITDRVVARFNDTTKPSKTSSLELTVFGKAVVRVTGSSLNWGVLSMPIGQEFDPNNENERQTKWVLRIAPVADAAHGYHNLTLQIRYKLPDPSVPSAGINMPVEVYKFFPPFLGSTTNLQVKEGAQPNLVDISWNLATWDPAADQTVEANPRWNYTLTIETIDGLGGNITNTAGYPKFITCGDPNHVEPLCLTASSVVGFVVQVNLYLRFLLVCRAGIGNSSTHVVDYATPKVPRAVDKVEVLDVTDKLVVRWKYVLTAQEAAGLLAVKMVIKQSNGNPFFEYTVDCSNTACSHSAWLPLSGTLTLNASLVANSGYKLSVYGENVKGAGPFVIGSNVVDFTAPECIPACDPTGGACAYNYTGTAVIAPVCLAKSASCVTYCRCDENYFNSRCSETCPIAEKYARDATGGICGGQGKCTSVRQGSSEKGVCQCIAGTVGPVCQSCPRDDKGRPCGIEPDLLEDGPPCYWNTNAFSCGLNETNCTAQAGWEVGVACACDDYIDEGYVFNGDMCEVCRCEEATCVSLNESAAAILLGDKAAQYKNVFCECNDGFAGLECNVACPGPCNTYGGGKCMLKKNQTTQAECVCEPGFLGATCQLKCPQDALNRTCSNVGACQLSADGLQTECNCSDTNHIGVACNITCPGATGLRKCLGRGECKPNPEDETRGVCVCNSPFEGDSCEVIEGNAVRVDQSLRLSLVWGVVGVTGKDPTDASSLGTPVYSPQFDGRAPETQQAIYDFCIKLFEDPKYSQMIRPKGPDSSSCIMMDFKAYLDGKKLPFPFQASYDDFRGNWTAFVNKYSAYRNHFGFDDKNKLAFIRVNMVTYSRASSSGQALKGDYQFWEQVIKAYNADLSVASVAKPLFQSSSSWPRVVLENAFVDGITKSVSITVLIAWASILLFTGNLYLSIYASLVLMITVISLVGSFVVFKWSLGPLEVVSLSISIGLGVDYTLHLGHVYSHSQYDDRVMRVKQSLTEIGSSVIAGAMTTLGSMLVLLKADIQIFVRMGMIVAATIILAMIYTMGLFLAFLMVFGPEKRQGDVIHWLPNWGIFSFLKEEEEERIIDPFYYHHDDDGPLDTHKEAPMQQDQLQMNGEQLEGFQGAAKEEGDEMDGKHSDGDKDSKSKEDPELIDTELSDKDAEGNGLASPSLANVSRVGSPSAVEGESGTSQLPG